MPWATSPRGLSPGGPLPAGSQTPSIIQPAGRPLRRGHRPLSVRPALPRRAAPARPRLGADDGTPAPTLRGRPTPRPRSADKEATAADVSDEHQEATCRALLPAGASVRVISDSGGHQSGFSAARDGYQALLAALAAGEVAAIAVYDLSRLARNARLMLDLLNELERRRVPLLVGICQPTGSGGPALPSPRAHRRP